MKQNIKNFIILFLILSVVGVSAFLISKQMRSNRDAEIEAMNAQLQMYQLVIEARERKNEADRCDC